MNYKIFDVVVVLFPFTDIDSNAGTNPATQTGLPGPQISTLIRTFSCFSNQKITCKVLIKT